MLVCGPESGKVIMTFILLNAPMALFDILSFSFFAKDASELSIIWRALIIVHVVLIVIVNYFFFQTACTDPGIIPAREWTSLKGERARRY